MLIAGAAAMAVVAARMVLGPGAAIIAALLAVGLRGIVALIVGPVLGAPTSWFALYLGPALVVELLALTPLIKRPLLFGAIGGLGVGTVGLWLESLWIDAVYRYPWPMSMWGEALTMAVPVAVVMGLCGALLGLVLTGRRLPRPSVEHRGHHPDGVGHRRRGRQRTAHRSARKRHCHSQFDGSAQQQRSAHGGRRRADHPCQPGQRRPRVGDNPGVAGWAGQRPRAAHRPARTGRPRTLPLDVPIPVWGTWKTLLRVQDGTTMAAVPIFLPADPGIDAKEVPAQASSTRAFVQEITVLQRERNLDHPAWLFTVASLVVLVCTLVLIAALAWGAGRINSRELLTGSEPEHAPPRPVQPQT